MSRWYIAARHHLRQEAEAAAEERLAVVEVVQAQELRLGAVEAKGAVVAVAEQP